MKSKDLVHYIENNTDGKIIFELGYFSILIVFFWLVYDIMSKNDYLCIDNYKLITQWLYYQKQLTLKTK